jgi:hypothetical protein
VHPQFLKCLHRGPDRGERRDADILDEDILGRRCATLHPVDHHDVGAGLHGESRIVALLFGRQAIALGLFGQPADLPVSLIWILAH